MEEVELFLAPLTARSKVREVLRGLVATRQVHTISLGHAPHFYVAGTLPEFAVPATSYSSSSMPAYFSHSRVHEDEYVQPEATRIPPPPPQPVAIPPAPVHLELNRQEAHKPAAETHAPRTPSIRKPAAAKAPEPRPHFSPARRPSHSRDRKAAASSSGSRPVRRASADSRPSSGRTAGARPVAGARWTPNVSKATNGATNGNGTHKSAHAANGNGTHKAAHNGNGNGAHSNGNGSRTGNALNGSGRSGNGRPGNVRSGNARPATGAGRTAKPAAPGWGQRNGHSNGAKPASKTTSRNGSLSRNGSAPRKDARADARPARGTTSRKPALAAGSKPAAKRFGLSARTRPGTKKRG
jgi:hypothetical protein